MDFEEIQKIAEYAPEQDTTISTPSDLLSEKLAQNLVINMPRITEQRNRETIKDALHLSQQTVYSVHGVAGLG